MKNRHFDERFMLGLNIQYYRKIKGYTQEQLAEASNISREHMSKIETAVSSASLDVLFDIAEALQIPINKLFEFKD